ncbi:esterase-like activity of phytase family protein [Aquidulcibacter sp.]|uniref:esterase-like activity of phytase family protein n=1 Tax=Aquidulcibacter sp. TaxID=2052990 RepID=UPI0025C37C2F|nr:esterase-like activity of phytase family protein [Aquidulcibacter sp.]MCA3692107.1 esterase-like activity of phytase family protein [Aquidulcibacter sp.]
MRVPALFALCLISSAACAQSSAPPVLETYFSTPISAQTLTPENLAGIGKTGQAELIYALRLETRRQDPKLPEEFGGLSSLSVRIAEGDTISFDAITDRGHLARFSAPNPLSQKAAIRTETPVQLITLTDPADKPLRGGNQIDSEGLAPTDTGFLISFERNHRLIELVKTDTGYKSQPGPSLTGFEGLEPNGGMEALARLPNGQYLASAEYGPDRLGDAAAKLKAPYWIFDQNSKAVTAPRGNFENQGRFGITDIRVLGEEVWVLKRSYDPATKINLSRLEACSLESVVMGGPICTAKLTLAPPFPMDNYEGLAVMNDPQSGGKIVFILSDDNFSADQGTFLLAFRLDASISANIGDKP